MSRCGVQKKRGKERGKEKERKYPHEHLAFSNVYIYVPGVCTRSTQGYTYIPCMCDAFKERRGQGKTVHSKNRSGRKKKKKRPTDKKHGERIDRKAK